MKTRPLALLSALVPLAVIVSGCGGGNSSGPATPTPIPAPTFVGPATGPSSFPTLNVPAATLVLPGGELGILNLKNTGAGTRGASGTLRVLSGVSSTNSLNPGTYALSGVFSTTGAFSVANQMSGVQNFSISGNVPAANNPRGIYFLKRGNNSSAAQSLVNDENFTRASTPYNPSAELTFSNARFFGPTDLSPNASIDFASVTRNGPGAFRLEDTTVFGAFFHFQIVNQPTDLAFDVTGTRASPNNPRQYLNLSIRSGYKTPFTVGQVIDLTNPNAVPRQIDVVIAQFTAGGIPYVSTRGTVIVRSFSAETLSLELRNVDLVTNSGSSTPGQPTGAVTLNGIFDATGISNGLRGDGSSSSLASNRQRRQTSSGTPKAPAEPRS